MNTPMKTSWWGRFFVIDHAGAAITAALLLLLAPAWAPGAQAGEECCPFKIVSIDTARGVVNAREPATGRAFAFTVKDRALLGQLPPGMNIGTRGFPGSSRFSLVLPATLNVRPKSVSNCCELVGQTLLSDRPSESARIKGGPVVKEGQPVFEGGPVVKVKEGQPVFEAQRAPLSGGGPLATRELAPGVVLEVLELKRVSDKVLHLTFAIDNRSDEKVDARRWGIVVGTGTISRANGIQLHDLEGLKYYRAGNASSGPHLDLKPRSRRTYWAQYRAPGRGVSQLTLNFPDAPPLYNVPIQ